MDDKLTERCGYAMAESYTQANNRENCVILAMHKVPEADIVTMRAMWDAIDAYVDLNPN